MARAGTIGAIASSANPPVTATGQLYIVGANGSGQTGNASSGSHILFWFAPSGLNNITNISGGLAHSMALRSTDGKSFIAGNNASGQLGLENLTSPVNTFADVAPGLAPIQQVAAGKNHSMILTTAGVLYVTGDNSSGQLGLVNTTTPVQNWTTNISGIQKIAAGGDHSLILKTNGDLLVAGNNLNGQLGLNNNTTPITAWTLTKSNIKDMAAGTNHSMYIDTTDVCYTVGNNSNGQLGNGNTTPLSAWFNAFSNVAKIAAGETHSMVLTIAGAAYVVGNNFDGQIGNDTSGGNVLSWYLSLSDIIDIAAGAKHSIALKTAGQCLFVGNNGFAQLGNGNTISQSTWVISQSGVTKLGQQANSFNSYIIK